MQANVYEIPESATQRGQDWIGKSIVSVSNGEKLGTVSDILINPTNLHVGGLLSDGPGLLNRSMNFLPAGQVESWGKDVIMAKGPNSLIPQNETQDTENHLLSVKNAIQGKYVVSADGAKVGQVQDVLLDQNGRLVGYMLSKVFIEGPLVDSKTLPARVTRSIGEDVMVVDLNDKG